jgi:hypothetical protein
MTLVQVRKKSPSYKVEVLPLLTDIAPHPHHREPRHHPTEICSLGVTLSHHQLSRFRSLSSRNILASRRYGCYNRARCPMGCRFPFIEDPRPSQDTDSMAWIGRGERKTGRCSDRVCRFGSESTGEIDYVAAMRLGEANWRKGRK